MNKIYISIAIVICVLSCNSFSDNKLNKRISEIEKMYECNYFVINYSDSFRYKILKKKIYHPYLYLRDSANLENLLTLVESDNPNIKIYAFAALVSRDYKDCFSLVVNNLRDTTKVDLISTDEQWNSYIGDIFLNISVSKFSTEQKDSLKNLILKNYNYLESIKDILLFQQKDQVSYKLIKSIALRRNDEFSIIALSRFNNPNDINLILNGFDRLKYYSGTFIFFKAIELYPEESFYDKLLSYSEKIKTHSYSMNDYMYYYYALARYPNTRTLKLLTKFCDKKNYSSTGCWESNLIHIYKAITKYKNPVYHKLIKDIEGQFSNFDELSLIELRCDDYINNNVWKY